MTIVLRRVLDNGVETTGSLNILGEGRKLLYSVRTLERAYVENKKNISCIPCGKYPVKKRWSIKFGNHFEVLNVPNRRAVLIHAGNFYTDTHGCILVDLGFKMINSDFEQDLYDSRKAMRFLNQMLPELCILEVTI